MVRIVLSPIEYAYPTGTCSYINQTFSSPVKLNFCKFVIYECEISCDVKQEFNREKKSSSNNFIKNDAQ